MGVLIMTIDKSSRKFLDNLIGSTPNFASGIYTYDHIQKAFRYNKSEMHRIISQQVKNGMLEYAAQDESDDSDFGVVLAQNGLKYKELQRLELLERWKERIIGYIFAVFSGLLIAYITYAFGWR